MRWALDNRELVSVIGGLLCGLWLLWQYPFPVTDPLLDEIQIGAPWAYRLLNLIYHGLLFSSPYLCLAVILSLVYVIWPQGAVRMPQPVLPPFPQDPERLQVVVGEIHHSRKQEPIANPSWLVLPERGLYTGIAIIGAIGSGKTTGCMYPFAEQILSFGKPADCVGGLVLEVKGDFCYRIKEILTVAGREQDYIEINLEDSPYCYNPLWNDLDAYALAYGIASLMNSLFGKGREPFWQQAYTNMIKFIILLHRVLFDYVTLLNVYECAINPDLLQSRIKLGELAMERRAMVVVEMVTYLEVEGLSRFQWTRNGKGEEMQADRSEDLTQFLEQNKVPHRVDDNTVLPDGAEPILDELKREQFLAVKRWFEQDWMRIEQRLRTSIVEGISFFLSLFDDSPVLKRVFCPPRDAFFEGSQREGRFSRPLPPFADLIEQGKVVALNFPASVNPSLSRMIGTLMKVDFQRAVLCRIPKMESPRAERFRQVMFLCDEYHSFVTAGETDPTGDEKFFALSRQAKCIPIVATQSISSLRSAVPGESWRTLLQTFRTKIFLTLSDDFSARVASDLCGRDEQLKLSYNFSESGQDAQVSLLSGRTTAHKASVSASKSYSVQRDNVFEARVFSELKNAQAIVLAYDGLNPIPPTFCYLKPYFLDRQVSYFEHLRRGDL